MNPKHSLVENSSVVEEHLVNELLKSLLIELSLKYKIKDLFFKMTGDDWEKHLVCPKRSSEYVYEEKVIERKNSFLEKEFYDNHCRDNAELEEYVNETTITDDYTEKKKTVHQLILLSKSLDKEMYELMKKIYEDEYLLNLLTLTNDKTYRNAVFYVDESTLKLSLKDSRPYVNELSFLVVLDYFKLNNEQFFIQIKSSKKTKNA